MAAAGNTCAQAEAEAASTLGLTGGAAASPAVTAVTQAADPAINAILIMTGSGTATPPTTYIDDVVSRYLTGFTLPAGVSPIAVTTAEGLYPITGVKDLTLDISLARGVTALDNQINLAIHPGTNQSVSVLGYSQSSIIASMEMPQLLAEGFTNGTGGSPVQAFFTLLGDPANPNGGLLARFPGLSLPSLGVTFGTATPSNDYPTTIGHSNTTASPTSRIRSMFFPTSTPSRVSHSCTVPIRLSRPQRLLRLSRCRSLERPP